jgi:hypothetical protein
MFCDPGLVFGDIEGAASYFHVMRSMTRFRRYRVRRVPFSCFPRPESIRRYRGRRVQFSCFALPDSFSAVPWASGPVFMFCAPGLIFGGTEGVGSRFHVLRAGTRFRRYRGRRVLFQGFALPDSFSAVPRASGPVFMFCKPRLCFGGTVRVGSRFHVLRPRTRFRRYRGRRVPFSCFALPNSFSAVPRTSGPILMFCAPGLVFSGAGGVGSRFHVLHSRTHFRRYRGRRVKFSCFALPDSFSAVPRASGPVFMFCAPGLIFGCTVGVGSRLNVLRSRTRLRRYRGRRFPFSCFARRDSFSAVPRVSGPVFMLCLPRLLFGRTVGVGSRFHVLRSRTRFRRN